MWGFWVHIGAMLYFILSCIILWAFIKLLKMVLWLTLAVLFSVSLSWVCLLTGDLEGGPDGMDFDEDNNLLVAHWGSGFLEVFGSEGGSPHTRIKLPFAKVSNLHFKKGTKEVYVTEHDGHGLWRFEWQRPGKLQYCDNLWVWTDSHTEVSIVKLSMTVHRVRISLWFG